MGQNKLTIVATIIALIVCAVFIFLFMNYRHFHMSSGSMEPALEVGDRFIVDTNYSNPERGDIIIFTVSSMNNQDFVKQIIGMPGETLQYRSGRLYINDELVERTRIKSLKYTNYRGRKRSVNLYEELLPGGAKNLIYEESDYAMMDSTSVYSIPEDHYMVLGTDRDNSLDSRANFEMGFIHKDQIIGEAITTTYSLYDCDQGKEIYCLMGIPLGRFFQSLN